MNDSVTIICEGQEHQIPKEIANSDQRLREALSVLGPEFAGAVIERKPNEPIKVTTRKGHKGSNALTILDQADPELNPAIPSFLALQQIELKGNPPPQYLPQLAQQLATELSTLTQQAEYWETFALQALDTLGRAASTQTFLVPGF